MAILIRQQLNAVNSNEELPEEPLLQFNHNKIILLQQHRLFLSNNRNKKCFLEMLAERCLTNNIKVRLAVLDAHSLIVSTALEEAKKGDTVVVVGQDTDLLV